MGQCPVRDIFQVLLFIVLTGLALGIGMKCSGYCTKDALKCQLRGGKIIGYCTKNLMCCDPLVSPTGSCGDRKSGQKVVFFKSPNYPGYAGGDLVCEFKVRIRNDTLAVRIDFLQVEMDGLSFDGSGENTASCESDMIFIRGFQSWSPPPRCGNLTGYGVLIDMDSRQTRNLGMLSIVALMSSPQYRFHIKITQTTKNSDSVWDVKESFIAKRSAPPDFTITSPNPTKVLIKTEKPPLTQTESSRSFNVFDSQRPNGWKTPSIINGDDTLISTVPWQVSIRVKPPPQLPFEMTEDASNSSSDQDGNNFDLVLEDYLTENGNDTMNCSDSEGIHFCGGSIFGDGRHILSAAHCFFGSSKVDGMLNVSSIMVVVGDTDKCSDDMGIFADGDSRLRSYRYDVESITFHYGYDHSLLINDVAIVRLNETIKYFEHVKPIVLANQGDNFEGHQGMVSGWGDRFSETDNNNRFAIEEPQGPVVLQSSKQFEIQNQSFCNDRELSQLAAPRPHISKYAKYMHLFDSTICTLTRNGSEEVNTGRGDSGGPLISFLNDSQPVLVGIVSYSIPPDEKVLTFDGINRTVDFYASVAFFRNWIDLVVRSFQDTSLVAKV